MSTRASLCNFTFSDGRRCRTPLSSDHPRLCRFHARKEAQAHAAANLGRDVGYFFSGRYLSAGDLNSALARLFADVAAGNVNPRTATTLAYLGQTLLQSIHLSQEEYINAFGTDSWRGAVYNSALCNEDHINGIRREKVHPSLNEDLYEMQEDEEEDQDGDEDKEEEENENASPVPETGEESLLDAVLEKLDSIPKSASKKDHSK